MIRHGPVIYVVCAVALAEHPAHGMPGRDDRRRALAGLKVDVVGHEINEVVIGGVGISRCREY